MNKERREPLLADLLLAADRRRMSTAGYWHQRALDTLTLSKKFVLDSQAASYLAQMLREDPRVVADAQDFAVPPFTKMWVEMPFAPFYAGVTGKQTDLFGDRTIGYLFDGPVVKVASHGWSKDSNEWAVGLLPVEYILHRPMSHNEELDLASKVGSSRMGLDLWFWGETASTFTNGENEIPHVYLEKNGELLNTEANRLGWDKEGLRALRTNHTARLAPMRDKISEQHWLEVMHGSAGDLRNIVALLLFLNRTSDIQTIREVPHGSFMRERQPRPMLAHRVISLKLDPMPRLRTLSAGEGLRRRLHDVKGHYCHDRKARAGCIHGAELRAGDRFGDFGEWWVEFKPLHWRCNVCNGERWWRKEHERGSREEGLVAAEYAVTR